MIDVKINCLKIILKGLVVVHIKWEVSLTELNIVPPKWISDQGVRSHLGYTSCSWVS